MTACGASSASPPASRRTRRRSAASRSRSSGGTRGGTRRTRAGRRGQKPIPPGPNNPLGTRWMGLSAPGVGIHGTPNPALDRLLRLARLHPHVHLGCRVAVQHASTSGRRSSSSPRRCRRAEARGQVAGGRRSSRRCSALLVWKVVAERPDERGAAAFEEGQQTKPRRLRPRAARTATARSSSRRCAARSSWSTSGPRGASRARARRRASRRRPSATADRSRSSASTRRTSPATRGSSSSATASRYPNVRDPDRSVLGDYGGLPIPRTFVDRPRTGR